MTTDVALESWRLSALCRGLPTGWFYSTGVPDRRVRNICGLCPVQGDCLAAAIAEESRVRSGHRYGFRGGKTKVQRDRIIARIAPYQPRPTVAKCGTDSGYYRHRRADEEACSACREAHTRAAQREAS